MDALHPTIADAIYDLTKAFDCVSHTILLGKLHHYGVRGVALRLLTSYLQDRQQLVEVNGRRSAAQPVERGVAQGSLMGPLLFILYINDLTVETGRLILYADDTTYVTRSENRDEGEEFIQRTSQQLQRWFATNELALNMDKTTKIHFCTSRRVSLEREEAKFLGVILDTRLTWLPHIEALERKLASAVHAVRRVTTSINREAGRIAYFAMFHSRMVYGLAVWGASAYVGRIFVLQKRAVRSLTGAGRMDSCRPLFKSSGILTLAGEYVLQMITEELFKNIPPKQNEIHHYNTRDGDMLRVPFSRLQTTDALSQAARLYNAVPEEIRTLPLAKWRTPLKKHLVEHPIYTVEEFLQR